MSRSKKKLSIHTRNNAGAGRWWKRSTNKKFRGAVRKSLHHCKDWDEYILPDMLDVSNPYDSPKDGYSIQFEVPDNIECIREHQRYTLNGYTWLTKDPRYQLKSNGHYVDKTKCDCIHNKQSSYWKGFRK